MYVLLIEDDQRLSDYIAKGLRESGHQVDVFADGRDGLHQAMYQQHDVLIIDWLLPGIDGLGIVKALRAADIATPILFLTSLSAVENRVQGLEAGADDYLGKPFVFAELLARVNALNRRPAARAEQTTLKVADLELDLVRRSVQRAGVAIELLPREFAILEVLMRNAGRVVTRTMLLEHVWGYQFDPQSSLIETHISRLRIKIDKPWPEKLLHTVRSMGYTLRPPR